jgi:flagellar FliL protein
MAQEEKPAENVPAQRNKKKLIVIILVLVVALAVGGAATVLLLGGKGKKEHGRKDARSYEPTKTVLVPFEEKFTVNIQSVDGSSHYLQVPKIELEVANQDVANEVEAIKSKISDRVSSVLRQKTVEEMLEPGSDVKLKGELRDMINKTIGISPGDAARKGVHEVILPASYLVQ